MLSQSSEALFFMKHDYINFYPPVLMHNFNFCIKNLVEMLKFNRKSWNIGKSFYFSLRCKSWCINKQYATKCNWRGLSEKTAGIREGCSVKPRLHGRDERQQQRKASALWGLMRSASSDQHMKRAWMPCLYHVFHIVFVCLRFDWRFLITSSHCTLLFCNGLIAPNWRIRATSRLRQCARLRGGWMD